MNGADWLMLAVTAAVNMFVAYMFMNDKYLKEVSQDGISEKIQMAYAGVFVLLNIGISVLFAMVYEDNSLLFSLKRLFMLAILWPVGYIDFKTYKIPNRYVVIGLSLRGVLLVSELIFERQYLLANIISEVVAAAALLIASILCSLCVKNGIGYGDIKLFVVLGLMLGMEGMWNAIMLSLIAAFIIVVVLLITGKKGKKDIIPFAPAITLGTYASIIMTGM